MSAVARSATLDPEKIAKQAILRFLQQKRHLKLQFSQRAPGTASPTVQDTNPTSVWQLPSPVRTSLLVRIIHVDQFDRGFLMILTALYSGDCASGCGLESAV